MDEEEKITFKEKKIAKDKKNSHKRKYFLFLIFLLLIFIILCLLYTIFFKINIKVVNKDNSRNFEEKKNKTHNFLILMPGKNCPNKNLKTLFVKRKNNDKFKLFENSKDKLINISQITFYEQTFFTETKSEFREQKLNDLGIKLKENMDIHNLYILPYSVGKKLKNKIKKVIINKYQKINRFFNYYEYVSKSSLYDNYKIMNEIFPFEYNYMLETYSYPEDKEIIDFKFKDYNFYNSSKDDIWLLKPKYGSYGNSISILKNISNIKNDYLVTKFLNNPHLIKGYKYDLRIHGLVSSIKPLKIYLYNEGLIRVASEKYDSNNLNNEFSFLTNLILNKKNKKNFLYPKNLSNIENSNLWNLYAFQKYCIRNHLNYTKMMEDIGNIFIKMVFSVRRKIIEEIQNYKLKSSNFYHLIGFDILFDENLNPYLLEANRRCGFRDDNDAEYYTHNIIADTINLVGIRILNKEKNTIFGYTKYKDELKEIVDDSLCELDRPRGGYKLLFPLKSNIMKYRKFYLGDIPKEDEQLWKELKE